MCVCVCILRQLTGEGELRVYLHERLLEILNNTHTLDHALTHPTPTLRPRRRLLICAHALDSNNYRKYRYVCTRSRARAYAHTAELCMRGNKNGDDSDGDDAARLLLVGTGMSVVLSPQLE